MDVSIGAIGARTGEPPDGTLASRRRTADRIFRGALLFTTALTLFWLVMAASGGNAYFFGSYGITAARLLQVLIGVTIFNVLWGFVWYGVKTVLLKRFAGFSADECRRAFSSRMREPYDVAELVRRHSERRIRIADMI